ncbi:MAG: hypothetical protein LBG07_09830 [Treponema sp.]|nr:hypothetical protein [Treponema sp.]
MEAQELFALNDELAWLLRSGGSLYAEETLVNGSSFRGIDTDQFDLFLQKKKSYGLFSPGVSCLAIIGWELNRPRGFPAERRVLGY